MPLKSQPESIATADTHPSEPLNLLTFPPHWRVIDFISDLHLADNTPATTQAFVHQLQHSSADAIVLLGDIFEVWVGDDARHDDWEAALCKRLRQASEQRAIFFMAGNRDFLLGPDMAKAAGMTRLADPCVLSAFGQRWLLSHGDAWCLEDTAYQAFRQQVRRAEWQQQFLALPLAQRRVLARGMREKSEASKRTGGQELWADLDTPRCISELQASQCHALIHGHTHRPAEHALGQGLTRHVMSDWDLDQLHGTRPCAEILRLSSDGLSRIPVHA